jgi:ABC-type sugar transport system, ATPase component
VDKMVGRALSELYPPKLSTEPDAGEVMMEVRNLASNGDFREVSFRLHRGEILGLFGLMGAGRSEIAKTICGLQERTAGDVLLDGTPVRITSYSDAISHGMIYLTEDRKTEGLFLPMSLKHNISAIDLKSISARSLINSKKESARAAGYVSLLGIRSTGVQQKVSSLSGGNQQKVVLGRCMLTDPKILLLDEPTRGMDRAARRSLAAAVETLTAGGSAVVLATHDTELAAELADRTIELRGGLAVERARGAVPDETPLSGGSR